MKKKLRNEVKSKNWIQKFKSNSKVEKVSKVRFSNFKSDFLLFVFWVEEFPPLFSTFPMKCGHHGNDFKVTDENDFLSR